MNRIYLIRHGMPSFPTEESYCIGRTELPLDNIGLLQACLLAYQLQKKQIAAVYSSPLQRCMATARFLSSNIIIDSRLQERNMGIWDGLPFSTIKKDYPKLYQQRGHDPDISIPDAESPVEAMKRFSNAVLELANQNNCNIAIIGHSSVNLSFLKSNGIYSPSDTWFHQPYGSYFEFSYEQGAFHPASLSVPHPDLTAQLCLLLLEAANVPQNVIAHCQAVSELALKIARELSAKSPFYQNLDLNLLQQGALLHDIARLYPKHAQTGALWLSRLGYPKIAELIRQHNDLDSTDISEASILFLADKYTQGDKYVSIENRFQKSYEKCTSPESVSAFQKRYQMAKELEQKIIPGL